MTEERIGRAQVMRRLLAHYDDPRYLEIGVCEGRTFDRVPARGAGRRRPRVPLRPHRARAPGARHQLPPGRPATSTSARVVEPDAQFDVIYLDGLHTVEQTLRDLLNALPHLQPHGVLVIDDVRPPTALAAIPDRQEFFDVRSAQGRDDDKAWMGDVFRLVFFIETFCQQLTFRVIANNHGQAVVWRHRRAEVPQRGLAEVGAMAFEEMMQRRGRARGWRRSATIIRELRADLGLGSR